jgi:hypothetical protein
MMSEPMAGFRVTKYDPRKRDANGWFLRDDWTAVSDVGRSFYGVVLTTSQYMLVEDAYVESVRRFLRAARLKALRIDDLEAEVRSLGLQGPAEENLERLLHSAHEGMWVEGSDLDATVRLCLRECLWCRLNGERGFYVHFGYDYYMYVGTEGNCVAPPLPPGMYAEEFVSPYHPEK